MKSYYHQIYYPLRRRGVEINCIQALQSRDLEFGAMSTFVFLRGYESLRASAVTRHLHLRL